MRVSTVTYALAAACCCGGAGAVGQDEPPVLAGAYRNDAPSFYLHAELNHQSAEYAAGEFLSLQVRSERDAYVYVQYQQADGAVYQVFPNSIQPDNHVTAGETVRIPGADDLFRWEVGPPFGAESIKVVASTTPIEVLAEPDLSDERFNRVEGTIVGKAAAALAKADPGTWAETDLALTTVERRDPRLKGRRVGVFFGVSKYTYSPQFIEVYGEGASMDLAVGHADALTLGERFAEFGRLDEVKTFIDGDASSANMKAMITEWLPSVTQPGDTVFIYYSGHGGTIPDDNDDEGDGLDETLCPADYLTPDVAASMLQRAERGELTLDERDQQRLATLVAAYQQAEANGQDAVAAMQRAAQVTDDAFGRWLQRLAGRNVVVIIDSCHSGGFASDKSLGRRGPTFDFLDGEMVRLKDIGHQGHAMLSAAAPDELAWENREDGLSVLTLALVAYLESGSDAGTLRDAYAYCERAMAEYFEVRAQQQRAEGFEPQPASHPQLVDFGGTNVYVKP